VSTDYFGLSKEYRGFLAPILLKNGQSDWSFVDLESSIISSLKSQKPCGKYKRIQREHVAHKTTRPFAMRGGTFILTTNWMMRNDYQPDERREFGVISPSSHLSTCQFSPVQGIFPARLRGGPFVHGMGSMDLIAIETRICPPRGDRLEYYIFEFCRLSRFQDPVRVLIRILQIEWPCEKGTAFAALVHHEPFSSLTVMEDLNGQTIRFCKLNQLVTPPTEVLAQLESQDLNYIDEYYDCEISETIDRVLPESGAKPTGHRYLIISNFCGEGVIKIRRSIRRERSPDWQVLRFSC
jgi:hypothetical protein